MANSRSALKRIKTAERNRLRNREYRSAVRTLMKNYFLAVEAYEAEKTPEALATVQERMNTAYSKIDRAVKRGVLPRNTGARRKARLSRALKRVEAPATSEA
ncbi:SSU ribosomal protein S20P [Thalassoporum mexicanum PCC 7367]|uniref:30S ribosomal protein S20 n=1 Tax=Thalassoporum mexicanum TaxID=3457544 RepID=UPI00029F9EF1|nr:30S ribosomal protein S20 [Pseudanabaena sp. PCC 7367]AFY70595.1 SSU ribosomal protein S20P [Pseudanabaena sp. PCC 7367]